MTKEEIIDLTNGWIEDHDFNGSNCDEPELEDNQLIYYLESPNLSGWVRQCYFTIPEDFYEWEEREQTDFLTNKYEEQLNEWAEDDEDFYKNIAFASGLDESDTEAVEKIIDSYSDFEEARRLLTE